MLFVCDSISRGSADCLPSVLLFLARAVPGAPQNRWHRGLSLSSFSHNSRLRERLAKEKGGYLCDGEGEGCSASCMGSVKQCWGDFAMVCLLPKLIWGLYLPQNLWLNSWEITVDET